MKARAFSPACAMPTCKLDTHCSTRCMMEVANREGRASNRPWAREEKQHWVNCCPKRDEGEGGGVTEATGHQSTINC